jgi:tetraacyldisaccharide 4'-kinase
VDSTDPFHNHHLLPRGLLREPIKNLRRADYVFLTKSDGSPRLRHLKRFIARYNPRAEIIECTHRAEYLEDVYASRRDPLERLRGARVAAISGIAVPQGFEDVLRELGAELVYAERFADHHRYRQQEVIDFVNAAGEHGAELIVTTEKDAVRFPKLDRRDIPVVFLRVRIDILSGAESFNDCITRICFL